MSENFVIDEKLVTENSDFLKAVAAAKTVEEAQGVCAEYNVDLPEDVWEEIQGSYHSGKLNEGELNDDDLDSVSGGRLNGSHLLNAIGGIAGLGVVIAAGNPVGVLVACAWIGFHAYRTFR